MNLNYKINKSFSPEFSQNLEKMTPQTWDHCWHPQPIRPGSSLEASSLGCHWSKAHSAPCEASRSAVGQVAEEAIAWALSGRSALLAAKKEQLQVARKAGACGAL